VKRGEEEKRGGVERGEEEKRGRVERGEEERRGFRDRDGDGGKYGVRDINVGRRYGREPTRRC
jgi:hypothetical protein